MYSLFCALRELYIQYCLGCKNIGPMGVVVVMECKQ